MSTDQINAWAHLKACQGCTSGRACETWSTLVAKTTQPKAGQP